VASQSARLEPRNHSYYQVYQSASVAVKVEPRFLTEMAGFAPGGHAKGHSRQVFFRA
jgi:hypothetical protein